MEKKFIRVDEVAKELEISESHAYKIMRKLNRELEAKGYITVAGRVNRQYCCTFLARIVKPRKLGYPF